MEQGGGAVTASYVDPMGTWWVSWMDATDVTVSELGPVGGFIDGTFSSTLGPGPIPQNGDTLGISGTFHVCHVPDQM
jgi:hypothetical protein